MAEAQVARGAEQRSTPNSAGSSAVLRSCEEAQTRASKVPPEANVGCPALDRDATGIYTEPLRHGRKRDLTGVYGTFQHTFPQCGKRLPEAPYINQLDSPPTLSI